uniref:Uncharacterized protein n=1 Tax=Meloidogyne enterolobii TaxID=390850 RepID=A0A6V7Y6S6_MELEN|nr:unnamed protein product [Meloidogyne enterolobii]
MEKEESNEQKHQNSENLSESKNNQVSTSFAFQHQFRRNSIQNQTNSVRREVSVTDSSSFLLFAQIIVCGTLFGIATILLWQLPFSTRFRNRVGACCFYACSTG